MQGSLETTAVPSQIVSLQMAASLWRSSPWRSLFSCPGTILPSRLGTARAGLQAFGTGPGLHFSLVTRSITSYVSWGD